MTGKRRFEYHPTTYPTEREARRELARLITAAAGGAYASPNKMVVRELLIEWLDGPARQTVRTRVLSHYESTIRNHVLPALGNVRIQDVTLPLLQRYYDDLLAGGVGTRTAELCVLRLRSAFRYAVRMQYVLYNPALEVQTVTPPRAEMHTWDAKQAATFLRTAQGGAYHPYWELALRTGMRRGELIGLRWDDVDLERGVLAVRRTVEPVPGGMKEELPKSGRARTLHLDETLITILKGHRTQQLEQRLRLRRAWGDERLVLTSAVGTWISPANLARAYDALVAEAGVPRIRLHDLRHTAATLMLHAGTPIKVVAERLGHASIQITLDLYAHVLPSQDQAAADNLHRLLAAES